MKQTVKILSVVTGLFSAFSFSVNAQTMYIPSGTGGIGSSTGSPNTNIGIGTSTPSNYLSGTNGLTLFGTYPGLAFARSAQTWLLYVQADNSFRLFEKNADLDRITVLPGGNVGIGTITPSSFSKLDVRGRGISVNKSCYKRLWIPDPKC